MTDELRPTPAKDSRDGLKVGDTPSNFALEAFRPSLNKLSDDELIAWFSSAGIEITRGYPDKNSDQYYSAVYPRGVEGMSRLSHFISQTPNSMKESIWKSIGQFEAALAQQPEAGEPVCRSCGKPKSADPHWISYEGVAHDYVPAQSEVDKFLAAIDSPKAASGEPEVFYGGGDLYSDAQKVHKEWCGNGLDCIRQDCGFWTQLSTMVDHHDMVAHTTVPAQTEAASKLLDYRAVLQPFLDEYTAIYKARRDDPNDIQPEVAGAGDYGIVTGLQIAMAQMTKAENSSQSADCSGCLGATLHHTCGKSPAAEPVQCAGHEHPNCNYLACVACYKCGQPVGHTEPADDSEGEEVGRPEAACKCWPLCQQPRMWIAGVPVDGCTWCQSRGAPCSPEMHTVPEATPAADSEVT